MHDKKWDVRFLHLSEHISTFSKDPSTKVGTIIVDDNRRLVSVGYNGLPKGVEDTYERLNNRELKYKIIVHGERNAMLFAGRPLTGCTLYTWPFQPCSACSSMVIQAGISRVVSLMSDNPRWKDDFVLGSELFAEAGVSLELLDPQPFGVTKQIEPRPKRTFGEKFRRFLGLVTVDYSDL